MLNLRARLAALGNGLRGSRGSGESIAVKTEPQDIGNPWLWLFGFVLIAVSWMVVFYILFDIVEVAVRVATLTR